MGVGGRTPTVTTTEFARDYCVYVATTNHHYTFAQLLSGQNWCRVQRNGQESVNLVTTGLPAAVAKLGLLDATKAVEKANSLSQARTVFHLDRSDSLGCPIHFQRSSHPRRIRSDPGCRTCPTGPRKSGPGSNKVPSQRATVCRCEYTHWRSWRSSEYSPRWHRRSSARRTGCRRTAPAHSPPVFTSVVTLKFASPR